MVYEEIRVAVSAEALESLRGDLEHQLSNAEISARFLRQRIHQINRWLGADAPGDFSGVREARG